MKEENKEIIHRTIKGIIGAVPFAGTLLTEYYSLLIASPIEQRKENWLIAVINDLEKLKNSNKIDIDQLKNDDEFISVLLSASQLAIRNHETEKLNALKNAVINSALKIDLSGIKKMLFLNIIGQTTVLHLKILDFLDNPGKHLTENNRQDLTGIPRLSKIVTIYFKDYCKSPHLLKYVLYDLDNLGLILDASKKSRKKEEIIRRWTSGVGHEFNNFIKEHLPNNV